MRRRSLYNPAALQRGGGYRVAKGVRSGPLEEGQALRSASTASFMNFRFCSLRAARPTALKSKNPACAAGERRRLQSRRGQRGSRARRELGPEALAAKNKLAAVDAKRVEDAFEQRLSELASAGTSLSQDDAPALAEADALEASRMAITGADPSAGIDKSVLAVAAPRRYRNREHLRSVAKQPCLICGRKPSDPHHLRYLQPRALGRKASDEFVVPLCRVHHRAVHRAREERAWWQAAGIDPIPVARKLWDDTRGEEGRIEPNYGASCRHGSSCKTWRGCCGASGTGLTTADMLTQIWACGELFHTATGTAYADLLVDGHRETWPSAASAFGAGCGAATTRLREVP